VPAAEALEMGLVGAVVAPDALEAVVTERAAALAAGAPLAQRFVKVALDRSSTLSFEQVIALESQAQAVLLTSEDVIEGVRSFLEKRPPEFRGR
jgi:enoyl-CoA hydratase/carnithine racemase